MPLPAKLARLLLLAAVGAVAAAQQQPPPQQPPGGFPGMSRDLSSFCSARPSLPIDLAPMVVHVKRNTSFNYKLYLFSSDYVFQTGQIVPRDDFRVHSFPVKLKQLAEFWPSNATAPSVAFDPKRFLALVALNPFEGARRERQPRGGPHASAAAAAPLKVPFDVHGDALPGDDTFPHHDVAALPDEPREAGANLNEHINFDRDDQVALLSRGKPPKPAQRRNQRDEQQQPPQASYAPSELIMPVGSFSSFHVNSTYLVRKDFGQAEPQVVRLQIDAARFQVTQTELIDLEGPSASAGERSFLTHKLLRDTNTRITSISQIYENWITRNFYTIVYVQRRISDEAAAAADERAPAKLVTDRLVFRGSSPVLLGADQLDYDVKASAFITEKNGLHYYVEFLTSGKFYLCAVDWSRRPFNIIDSHTFPIGPTKTKFDNEELLLCPPAVCYSEQPVDEIASYGRSARNDGALASAAAPPPAGQLDVRLHLRDWTWKLARTTGGRHVAAANATASGGAKFGWQYERATRNELKPDADLYGFVLTGHEIGAAYRVGNELYLVSADRLISVNYTLANETVTSSHPIGDEFPGLSSSLLEPITAAFYDEASNQIYFFKGDRYVGFDYATKQPLGDFALSLAASDLALPEAFGATAAAAVAAAPSVSAAPLATSAATGRPALVSSLPVVGLLGRQHQVDAIWHDEQTNLVYVFTGMKFYTFEAADFKEGAFKLRELPPLRCINEHFLDGCRFDAAYPNPCRDADEQVAPAGGEGEVEGGADNEENVGRAQPHADTVPPPPQLAAGRGAENAARHRLLLSFNQEQQMKLRSIAAARGNLFDFLLDDAADSNEPSSDLVEAAPLSQPERLLMLLVAAIFAVTLVVALAALVLVVRSTTSGASAAQAAQDKTSATQPRGPAEGPLPLALSRYLENQQHSAAAATTRPATGNQTRRQNLTAASRQQQQQHQQHQIQLAAAFLQANKQQRGAEIVDSSAL